ncbi:MAG: tRNA lysidine(34) synthetase TilS [Acidobacteriota bacterium]|nr:tRNA lysidine(34) synthetase TilS [Acidobacteriota bacterium]
MSLTDSVLRTIRRYDMLPAGGRVAVALSGGPDSVALLHLLRALETRGELVVAGTAHFNHQLRGAASDGDQAFCRKLALDLGVPLEVGSGDVRATARIEKRSVEDAARRMRYAFLSRAARTLKADAIAVGHSRDDQAETFLLRLLRGSGTRGLGSIRPKAGIVIRPLLEINRAELRQFAAAEGLTFREDATNTDVAIPRNRIRHELLPYLEREFTAGIVEVLAREAALAQDDEDKLEAEAVEKAASTVLSTTASVRIDAREIGSLHPALASRVARRALQQMAGERFVGFEHVHRFLAFVRAGAAGQAMSLPGQQAVHHGSTVLLGSEPDRGRTVSNLRRLSLPVPGEVVLERPGIAVSARWTDGMPASGSGESVLIKGVTGALAVRFRSPGDRFDPPGLGGRSKKLQDYLVDRKVARADRDVLPLVVDDTDRIVWVVGHGVAEGVRAPEASPGVILLKVRRLGGEV